MQTLTTLAQSILNGNNNGQVLGVSTKGTYTLWSYTFNPTNHHIYYNYEAMLGKDVVKGLAKHNLLVENLFAAKDLSANWHTQAHWTSAINAEIRRLREEEAQEQNTIYFGKRKGERVDEITDRHYINWLANCPVEGSHLDSDCFHIKQWLKDEAIRGARRMGMIEVNDVVVDPEGTDRYSTNTMMIHKAIETFAPISYNAEDNAGGLWSAYWINLPTRYVGHPYYGECRCLDVDGKARKVKGMKITIYDYNVVNDQHGTHIEATGYMVERA